MLYRLGSFIPLPGVNATALKAFFEGAREGGNTLFGLLDLFVGGNFERASVFALGIMPILLRPLLFSYWGVLFPILKSCVRKEPKAKKS